MQNIRTRRARDTTLIRSPLAKEASLAMKTIVRAVTGAPASLSAATQR